MTDIPFHSVCAHHFLPFYGTVHLVYVPKQRLVGLSKLARVVDFYARRPQLAHPKCYLSYSFQSQFER